MPLGEGMSKEEWEDKMCKFFHRLLRGCPLQVDPMRVGVRIKYLMEDTTYAEWETQAVNQEFDKQIEQFLKIGLPPEDPKERRKWEADRRKKRDRWEAAMRSGSGAKCPACGGWDTVRIEPKDLPKNKLTTFLSTYKDYLVCKDCGTRTMYDSEELEFVHNTEIIFLADILSRPFSHNGKIFRMRHPDVYVVKVQGQHDQWKQEEVRRMIQVMFTEEIVPLWTTASEHSFLEKLKELSTR